MVFLMLMTSEEKQRLLHYVLQGIKVRGVVYAEMLQVPDENTLLIAIGVATGETVYGLINEYDNIFLLDDEYEWLIAGGLKILARIHGIKNVEAVE